MNKINKGVFIKSSVLTLAILLASSQQGMADNFRTRSHQMINKNNQPLASDLEAEIRFGRHVAARILGRQQLLNNPALSRYVSLVGTSLSLYSPRPELRYHFAIVEDAAVNAYSTPGGYIFVTSGAIDLAEDEAELAAILAHEIAHITEKHIVNELNITGSESDAFSNLAIFLGGSGNSSRIALAQSVDKAVSILFEEGYKVAEELNADRVALELLAQSGYEPSALVRLLHRAESTAQLAEQKSKAPSTHPRPTERFAHIKRLIKQDGLNQASFHTRKNRFDQHTK